MTASITNRKASRRERKGAKELLRVGLKVWLYKKDCLSPALEDAIHRFKAQIVGRPDADIDVTKAAALLALHAEPGSIPRKLDVHIRASAREKSRLYSV